MTDYARFLSKEDYKEGTEYAAKYGDPTVFDELTDGDIAELGTTRTELRCEIESAIALHQ